MYYEHTRFDGEINVVGLIRPLRGALPVRYSFECTTSREKV
jgi:hypothetical protein